MPLRKFRIEYIPRYVSLETYKNSVYRRLTTKNELHVCVYIYISDRDAYVTWCINRHDAYDLSDFVRKPSLAR